MRRRIVAVIAMFAAVGVLSGGCGLYSDDPRAYPDSRNKSFEDLLVEFSLRLPSCATSDLRYFASVDNTPNYSFELTFRAATQCVDEFLRVNGADLSVPPDRWPGRDLDHAAVGVPVAGQPAFYAWSSLSFSGHGWKLDPQRKHDLYQLKPGSKSFFSVAVEWDGKDRILFLMGGREG